MGRYDHTQYMWKYYLSCGSCGLEVVCEVIGLFVGVCYGQLEREYVGGDTIPWYINNIKLSDTQSH